MTALLDALQYAILPVFAFPALGFVLGRAGRFGRAAAQGTNQYVVTVAVPCLLFFMLARADLSGVDWPVMAVYTGSNLALYAAGYVFCRYGFGIRRREAVLIAMTGAFPNHVFFILPIAEQLYGADAALPIATMIFFDVVTLFAGSVMIMEALAGSDGPLKTLRSIALNPLLIAMASGAAWNASGFGIHDGVARFLSLAAASAAPASLFALGVILSSGDLSRVGGPAWTATILKVLIHPLIAVILFGAVVPVSAAWEPVAVIVFAAPCGAMAFVLGVKYDVPVDSVAKAIILSTVLSVFTVALLA